MLRWWKDLDRILRGEATRLPALRRGTIEVPVGGIDDRPGGAGDGLWGVHGVVRGLPGGRGRR